MIVADLYGPQQLLKSRSIPPALVFGNPGVSLAVSRRQRARRHLLAPVGVRSGSFSRRPVVGAQQSCAVAGGRRLRARKPDHHVALPAGHVRKLQRASPRVVLSRLQRKPAESGGREDHLAVVLSPGAGRSYFEHAFLGRYLGYPVVEGADLTVRAGRVYLKTLEGLKPVELILRRVESNLCDPLELRVDSSVGVAGLLQAARRKRSGDREFRRQRRGRKRSDHEFSAEPVAAGAGRRSEDPERRDVVVRKPGERAHVLAHLDELVVRRAFASRSLIASGSRGSLTSEFGGLSARRDQAR